MGISKPNTLRIRGKDYYLAKDGLFVRDETHEGVVLQVPIHVSRVCTGATRGWQIRIERKKEPRYSRLFSDNRYATPGRDGEIAVSDREKMIAALEACRRDVFEQSKRHLNHVEAVHQVQVGRIEDAASEEVNGLPKGVFVTILPPSGSQRYHSVLIGGALSKTGKRPGMSFNTSMFVLTPTMFERQLRDVCVYRTYLEQQFLAGKPASRRHFDHLSGDRHKAIVRRVSEMQLMTYSDLFDLFVDRLGVPSDVPPERVEISRVGKLSGAEITVSRKCRGFSRFTKKFTSRVFGDKKVATLALWYGDYLAALPLRQTQHRRQSPRLPRKTGIENLTYGVDASGSLTWIAIDRSVDPPKRKYFSANRLGFQTACDLAYNKSRLLAGKGELPEDLTKARLVDMAPRLLRDLPQSTIDKYKLADFLAREAGSVRL